MGTGETPDGRKRDKAVRRCAGEISEMAQGHFSLLKEYNRPGGGGGWVMKAQMGFPFRGEAQCDIKQNEVPDPLHQHESRMSTQAVTPLCRWAELVSSGWGHLYTRCLSAGWRGRRSRSAHPIR